MSKRRRMWFFIGASFVTATVITTLVLATDTRPHDLWAIWISALSAFYMGGNTLDYLNDRVKAKNDPPPWMKRVRIENTVAPEYFMHVVKNAELGTYDLSFNLIDRRVYFTRGNLVFRTVEFTSEDRLIDFRLEVAEVVKEKQERANSL